MATSAWKTATRPQDVEANLECSCSARNYGCVRVIHLDDHGRAFCDNCSKYAPVREFLRED